MLHLLLILSKLNKYRWLSNGLWRKELSRLAIEASDLLLLLVASGVFLQKSGIHPEQVAKNSQLIQLNSVKYCIGIYLLYVYLFNLKKILG